MPTSQTQNEPSEADERERRVSDRVERAAEGASEATLARVEAVRDQAQSTLTAGRDRAVERIRRASDVFRGATVTLHRQDAELARFADMAVDRIDQVADYVGRADPRTVANDLSQLARNQPLPFFGGAFLVGFSLGRLLKVAVEASSDAPSEEPSEARTASKSSRTARQPSTP